MPDLNRRPFPKRRIQPHRRIKMLARQPHEAEGGEDEGYEGEEEGAKFGHGNYWLSAIGCQLCHPELREGQLSKRSA